MKKLYKKPIMLDTCVAKYLFGIQGEHDEIVKNNINEEILKRYIKHHGCVMSVFTLFEILRKHDYNEDVFIRNLKLYNVEVFTPYSQDKDIFSENYIEEIKDKTKATLFLDTINKEIIVFASKNISEILTYPMDFLLFGLVNLFREKEIDLKLEIINRAIYSANEIISKKIYNEMLKVNYFVKSKISKIINCTYKWIAKHLFDWFNNEANNVVIKLDSEEFYNALNVLLDKLNSINLEDEIIMPDHSIKADGKFNMLYVLCEKMKETNNFVNLNIDELFVQKNLEIIKRIYHTQERNVENVYLEKNIYDLYLSHIISKKGKSEPELKLDRIFDSNDIIDLLSCKFAIDNKFKFITTDGNLNNVISQVEQDLSINKLFIKNIY